MSGQRIGKYACLEIERKYLLRHLPPDLNESDPHWRIVDRYLIGTRLRLRQMISSASGEVVHKLGQKYRTATQDPCQFTMTNLYLSTEEHRRLATLDAHQIVKRRYAYQYQDRCYSIDLFEGRWTALLLAEIECETVAEATQLSLPSFACKDVTGDPFFSGGALAAISQEAFREGLVARLQ